VRSPSGKADPTRLQRCDSRPRHVVVCDLHREMCPRRSLHPPEHLLHRAR